MNYFFLSRFLYWCYLKIEFHRTLRLNDRFKVKMLQRIITMFIIHILKLFREDAFFM